MKRGIAIGVIVIIVAGAFGALRLTGGCGGTRSRIAQKKIYEGPTTLSADAAGWPHWRGPLSDGISQETNLAQEWPAAGPAELWTAEVGIGYASPIAVGGRIYLFTMTDDVETLTCFDANSGRIIWNQPGGRGRTASYPGTRATPSIDGNEIITLGGAGELTCRDVSSGAKRWSTNILEETGATALDWGTASNPLVSGNLIYVQVGQGGPVAVAIDRTSGAIAWRSEAVSIAGYANPILIDLEGMPQLVVFGGKAVYGMDPATGKTLWEHAWSTSYDVNASTPIFQNGRLFLTSGYGSGSIMLQLSKTGAPTVVWQNQKAQSRFQQAILDDNHMYLNSEGSFMCLNWSDGKILWRDENVLKLGLGGSFVRFGGDKMISLGERGRMTLAKATPEGIKVVSGVKLLEGTEIWATPLIYGGRLYVKGIQELVCYDISAGGKSELSNSNSETKPSTQAVR